MREGRPKLSRGSDQATAFDYMLKRWPSFARFLPDGRVCMSNNAAARALRGIALGRKLWLFAGSDRGGQRAAAMYSLIVTAKMCDIDPQAWLADVLARIDTHPVSGSTNLCRGTGARPTRTAAQLEERRPCGAHRMLTTGSELLFEVCSQRYERGSTIVTSNLPFENWTSVFSSERLTGALLDRLTHHVHILEMNGDSYRLKQSKGRKRKTGRAKDADGETGRSVPAAEAIGPDTGEINDQLAAVTGTAENGR